jgi:hypothetical protein
MSVRVPVSDVHVIQLFRIIQPPTIGLTAVLVEISGVVEGWEEGSVQRGR